MSRSRRRSRPARGRRGRGKVARADTDPAVTVYGVRRDGVLLGLGAIRRLDATHAELKSMHVVEEARGQGLGRVIVEHLLAVAAERGYHRVSLETGTGPAFAPAYALYTRAGSVPCAPFATTPTTRTAGA